MQKQIVLTEEEYQTLLDNSKLNPNKIIIDKEEYKYYQAIDYTINSFLHITRICPKCNNAMLVDGYVCPCCNYDDSDYEE